MKLDVSRRGLISGLLISTSSVTRLGAKEPPASLAARPPSALSLIPPLEDGFRRLYLVRHGETEWNVEGRIQGRTDKALNDNGRRQARLLAEYLRGAPLEMVASSTLQRAASTADTLAEFHPKAERRQLASFSEMCFGDYEGQVMASVVSEYKGALDAWAAGDTSRSFPGRNGESPEMVAARGRDGLRSLGLLGDAPTAARHVCLVAHSRFNKILIASLQGDLSACSALAQGNTCLNVLDIAPDGYCVVRALNLREHLLAEGTALRDSVALDWPTRQMAPARRGSGLGGGTALAGVEA